MKVTEFLEHKNKTSFSFEIIPPFRGGSIDKVFSLDNISDAHKYIEDSNQFGKVILVP